jgi:glycosyltransferase involved in cell wall biosynthesis
MTQVYNQNTLRGYDGKTNIERFMESVSQYCDGLVVFDDGSTDGTRDVITSFSGDFELEIPSNSINTPDREGYHRARSLEHCKRMGADWVLTLDPDEVIEKRGENGHLRIVLDSVPDDIAGVGFYKRELWRSDRYVRVDTDWSHRINVRAFRLPRGDETLRYDIEPAYRSSLVPDNLPTPYAKSALRILHYAYINDLAILEKYNRWMGLGVDISSELDDSDVRLSDANPEWFGEAWPQGPGIEAYQMQVCRMLAK